MATNLFTDGRAVTALEVSRLAAGIAAQTFAQSGVGGAVTTNAAMTLNVSTVAANTVTIGSTLVGTAYTGSTVVISASDPTNPRRDAITYDTSGVVAVTAGTPAAVTATTGPVLPTITATQFMLCEVYVGAGVTSIVSGNLTDRRQVAQAPIAIPEYITPLVTIAPTLASATKTGNTAYFTPMVPITAPVTCTLINWAHTVASGNYDVGIYSWDGTTMTRVVSLGSTASPAIGSNRVSSNITDTVLYPGIRYFFAWAADNATESVYALNSGSSATSALGYSKATSFPLPATAATLANATTPVELYGVVSTGIPI